jgi:hypothetical protein
MMLQAQAAAPPAPRNARVALLGPGWDLLLVGPGATVAVSVPLLALMSLGHVAGAAAVGTLLTLVFVGPHYAATYRRAYGSLGMILAHPFLTLAAPVLLAGGAAVAIASPTRFGTAYFLAYVAWSGFHYARQSLGLAMLYPLRQGARLDAREKRLLSLPLYVSWVLSLLGLLREGTSARNSAYGLVRQALAFVHLPGWVVAGTFAALAASLAGVGVVAVERHRRGAPLPPIVYGILATQISWFAWGLYSPYFNVWLVPVFHAMQYLALTSWHHQRNAGAEGGAARFGRYALVVALVGVVLTPGLTVLLASHIGSANGLASNAAIISFINLHHFLLDGRIWRLRDRKLATSMLA